MTLSELVNPALVVAFLCMLFWLFYAGSEDAPRLRVECEARGGMLISTRNEMYVCVGKPHKEEGEKK